jgi:uncharacterized protein (TIGR00299 family) protein
MILGALLDLGVELTTVKQSIARLGLSDFQLKIEKVTRNSIQATRFWVEVDQGSQPQRSWADIRALIEKAGLSAPVARLALQTFLLIAEAEGRVHGRSVDEVHFHEVGAVDSIVDIVGAAAAIVSLGARVVSSPLPLGRGTITTRHGVLPVPAPATVLILDGVPVEGTEIEAELTTPTGAALVKAAASSFGLMPRMIPRGSGYGAGARSHATRPGLLRAVLGQPLEERPPREEGSCHVIEANIDDMTPEIAAHASGVLLESGALDVWFEPIQMKKGRPALKLSLLVGADQLDRLCEAVLRETPTIGLRYYRVGRVEMERSMAEVQTPWGAVRVKIARGLAGSVNAAPEFEDCRRLAQQAGVPLKQVMALAAGLAQQLLEKDQQD